MIDYPEYNPELPGFICSSCGSVTDINYDDTGIARVAPLCKVCRDEWDLETKAELAVIGKPKKESEWLKYLYAFNSDYDLLQMLKDYRKTLGLTVEIDSRLQAIADDYINQEIYNQVAEGLQWFNDLVTKNTFTSDMGLVWLEYKSEVRFTVLPDLFKRELSKEMIKGKNLKVGIAKSDRGVFFILSEG